MDEALLDTDILSEALKAKDAQVLANAQQYLSQYGRFSFSAITFYEVLRGLVATGASKQLTTFLQTAANSNIMPVSIPVLRRSADLWAMATAGGHPRDDADLMIAATALEAGHILVTGNKSHFDWIPGLRIEDWRLP